MKFVELKKSLVGKLSNIYLLEGEDRFVVNNALSLIEKRVGLNMPSVNRVVIEGEKGSVEDVLFQLNSFPFGDEHKLIIIRDFNTKDNLKKFEEALKTLPEFIVMVVISYASSAFSKLIKQYAEYVDCSKLDPATIKGWIGGKLSKAGICIEEKAMENLVLYTSYNMARIETEVNKLTSMGEDLITAQIVDKYVTRDKEYQIYELAEFLAKKDSEKVYDLVETMLESEKNGVGMVQYLYSAFRKLLIIALSKETDDELARLFKVKPYAIKMSRMQAKKFTPKELKRINEELSSLEFELKTGKANQDNAVHVMVAKILLSE